jgi:hypothetical protein
MGQTILENMPVDRFQPSSTLNVSVVQGFFNESSPFTVAYGSPRNLRPQIPRIEAADIICQAHPARLLDLSIALGNPSRSEGRNGSLREKTRFFVVLFTNPMSTTLDVFLIFSYNDRGIMHLPQDVRNRHMYYIGGRQVHGTHPGPLLKWIKLRQRTLPLGIELMCAWTVSPSNQVLTPMMRIIDRG